MNLDRRGVHAAATTEFFPDEALDLSATTRHFSRLIDGGIHGLVVMGTVGEGTSLELDEKRAVLQAGLEASQGRVPVVTGVAEYTTRGACRWAAEAQRLGADGLMVLPGMVYKSQPHETIQHFRAVVLAYRRRLIALLLLGAVGWVSGLVNAFPEENRLLWDLATAGRWEEARAVYRWYMPLLHLDTRTTLVQCIKLAAAEVGIGSETVRAPRRPLEGRQREEVLQIIRTALKTRPQRADYQ